VPLANNEKKVLGALGANVRRERMARGITQEKLAELADLNIRTIQKIESGELNVLITTLIRIQRGLGCKWNRLVPSGE
jgi:transcriptional regulator with XRE-family HTH domain